MKSFSAILAFFLFSLTASGQPFLGLLIESISPKKAEVLGFETPHGIYLKGVVPGSGAAQAGLRATDYVIGIDDHRVGPYQNLGMILQKYAVGDQVLVVYIRDGQTLQASASLGARDEVQQIAPPDDCQRAFLGVSPKLSGAIPNSNGVQIAVVAASPAQEMGLKSGDQITRINGLRIVDWRDISIAMAQVEPSKTLTVVYLRNGVSEKTSITARSHAEVKKCENCDCSTLSIRSDDIDLDFDFDFDFDFNWNNEEIRSSPPPNIPNLKTEIQELSASDERQISAAGLQMPQGSPLPVRELRTQSSSGAGQVTLEFELPQKGNTEVKIVNAAGRSIYQFNLSNFTGQFSDEVRLAQNGPGTYFLEIRQGNQSLLRKIIVAPGQ